MTRSVHYELGYLKRVYAYRRTSIDDCADRCAVALAIGSDAEKSTKGRHDDLVLKVIERAMRFCIVPNPGNDESVQLVAVVGGSFTSSPI